MDNSSTEHSQENHAAAKRSHRKGHYSCDFCRSRKLRCDRPLPCANCVSRGKKCNFGAAAGQQQQQQQQQAQLASSPAPRTPQEVPQPSAPGQGGLLAEVHALRKLVQDLEKRVIQSANNQTNDNGNTSQSASPYTSGPALDLDRAASSGVGQVSEVVAHLERVSMGQSSHGAIYGDELIFIVDHIRAIPRAPSHTVLSGSKLTRCVRLPKHDEAKVLLSKYIANVSYIHHIVHHPSLPAIIDDIYHQIGGQDSIKLGHLILLLSIIASTTHVWTPHDDAGREDSLFFSSAEANAQTLLWIKATYDVLNAAQDGYPATLETVQGIIILSFLICNLEGVSLRYRFLISTGLLLSRELGLHRIDDESNASSSNTIEAEVGRRVWWYLVATDWLLSARYGRPGDGVYQAIPQYMLVKKPRNINDVDLIDNGVNLDLPIIQPTEMSYFLQRIRLAEISRRIVDRYNDSMLTSSSHAQVMAMDAELDQMIRNMPTSFHLDSYEHIQDLTKSGIFIQAYLLNSIIYTQRCKLHLGYLTSKPNDSSTYAYSRDTCLKAARQIIRAEVQLERTRHVFALVRLRLSGILHAVFMAGIVLIMDACVSRSASAQDELRSGEAAEALRIINDAKGYSVAAANLQESLTQVLASFRTQKQQRQQNNPRASVPPQLPTTPAANSTTNMTPAHTNRSYPDPWVSGAHPTPQIDAGGGWESNDRLLGHMSDLLSVPIMNSPSISSQNELMRSLEELTDFDGFQWDDLFPGINSSSFI